MWEDKEEGQYKKNKLVGVEVRVVKLKIQNEESEGMPVGRI